MIKMISRMKKPHRSLLVSVILCAVVLWTVQDFALTFVQVKGESMLPSYVEDQVLFVNRLAYGLMSPIIGPVPWVWKAPQIGDPVVVRRADEGHWVVKRVVGTPGLAIRVADHRLRIGDASFPLSASQEYWLSSCVRIPEGSFFVVGDNIAKSRDSRDWGFVALADIVGKAGL